MRKTLILALALSLVGAVVALVAVWTLSLGERDTRTGVQLGDSAVPSTSDASDVGIKGIIKYTVWGADGKVKTNGVIHNTVNDEAKNETFNRIAASASGGAYDGIAALNKTAAEDDPSDGVAAASITLTLDGDSGTGGNQNPADGTVTTDFGTETGNGTIAVTFTAKGDGLNVKQIVLTKAAEDDTSDGAAAIADADIFAYVDVPDIVLNTDDTVQYTWTVDVD